MAMERLDTTMCDRLGCFNKEMTTSSGPFNKRKISFEFRVPGFEFAVIECCSYVKAILQSTRRLTRNSKLETRNSKLEFIYV